MPRYLRRCLPVALAIAVGIGCARPSTPTAGWERPRVAVEDYDVSDARVLPPMWRELQPGPHGVGYRVLTLEDPSRSYRLHTEVAAHPRPIVAGVWYPARRNTGDALTLRDYFVLDGSGGFAKIISAYLQAVVVEAVFEGLPELLSEDEQGRLDHALGTAAMARRDAVLAATEGPLLLAHPGLGGAYPDGMVLYEYLASHGWVVVAGLFQQARGNWINVDWDPSNSVQDLDLLRREVPRTLGYAPSVFASLGHSYGAQAALVYASLPDRVQAVVSLDSTMDRDPPWWKDDDHGPWLDRAGLIEVPALLFFQAGKSRSFFDEIGAPRELVTVEGLAHNDFEGLAGA
ncbi:MAG: alpha/beta hydrolase, partial [Deltaproteobacteria bacterium]|nr:alpha/beta hydrolase [Deltaproteobacteria bacterium]